VGLIGALGSRCEAGRINRASENLSDATLVVGISYSLNATGDNHQIFIVHVSVAPGLSRELVLRRNLMFCSTGKLCILSCKRDHRLH
jgi:hypothetical protein